MFVRMMVSVVYNSKRGKKTKQNRELVESIKTIIENCIYLCLYTYIYVNRY